MEDLIRGEFMETVRSTVKTALRALLALLIVAPLCWGTGCSSRSVGSGAPPDGGSGGSQDAGGTRCQDVWECNPGVTCGELVPCEGGQCRPDLGHVIIPCTAGECSQNADCVVAKPASCCWGCPQVVSREALAELECFFEEYPPGPLPPECDLDCFYCADCVPQPLGARCDDGLCVPTDLGCPVFSEDPVPSVTTLDIQQNAAQLEGQRRRIRGVIVPGEGSCDGEGCSAQYGSLLNGVVALEGSLCNLTVDLTGDECRANLQSNGLQAGAWYELEGIVHQSPSAYQPPWLEVTGSRLIDPEDLGGRYAVTVTEIINDASDPTCVPSHWTVGDIADVYLAKSGPQILSSSPAFHCEANFYGGYDEPDSDWFTTWLPMDCDVCCCDLSISGRVAGEQLSGEYEYYDGTCRTVVRFTGPRSSL